jgi:hypothetical protein
MVVETLVARGIMVVFQNDIVVGLLPDFMDGKVAMIGER